MVFSHAHRVERAASGARRHRHGRAGRRELSSSSSASAGARSCGCCSARCSATASARSPSAGGRGAVDQQLPTRRPSRRWPNRPRLAYGLYTPSPCCRCCSSPSTSGDQGPPARGHVVGTRCPQRAGCSTVHLASPWRRHANGSLTGAGGRSSMRPGPCRVDRAVRCAGRPPAHPVAGRSGGLCARPVPCAGGSAARQVPAGRDVAQEPGSSTVHLGLTTAAGTRPLPDPEQVAGRPSGREPAGWALRSDSPPRRGADWTLHGAAGAEPTPPSGRTRSPHQRPRSLGGTSPRDLACSASAASEARLRPAAAAVG